MKLMCGASAPRRQSISQFPLCPRLCCARSTDPSEYPSHLHLLIRADVCTSRLSDADNQRLNWFLGKLGGLSPPSWPPASPSPFLSLPLPSPVMTTLPSFVDLLSSLGLNDKDSPNHQSHSQHSAQSASAHLTTPAVGHLRSDSWESSYSQPSSSTSSRVSPLQSPRARAPSGSGRQISSHSTNASSAHRFAPYGAPPPREVSMLLVLMWFR